MARDLQATKGIMAAVTAALRRGAAPNRRVGWLYVSRGIMWGQNDKIRADEFGIRILTDNDFEYFLRLAKLIGTAARHQLQADIFGNKEIEGLNRTVLAVRGKIAGRRFYQFTIEPDRLLKIAFISHRQRLDAGTVDAYQRMLKASRLKSIREYIDAGGLFPTNIVVNFRSKRRFDASAGRADDDVALGTLYLPNSFKSAWVIDGQHRLYGFAGSKRASSNQLPVLAFERLPPVDEARLFVDINNKQVKVPRSLLVDLTAELYWGSDVPDEAFHALLSRIVAVLGREVGSPLRNRMVQEGETQTPDTPLTITGIYEALRKSGLVGTIRKGTLHPGPLYEKDDQSALSRSVRILSGYLGLFAGALPEHWARGSGEGGYLCTNNGTTALLAVLAAVVDHLDAHGSPKPWQATPDELVAAAKPFVTPIAAFFAKADSAEIRAYRRQVGNVGQRTAALGMMQLINAEKPGFNPPGLDDYIRSQDETGTNQARQLMPELQLRIQSATLSTLHSAFGDDESGWWRTGVPAKVRTEVAARREADPKGGAYEEFFELLDYRSIALAHWPLYQDRFSLGVAQGGKEARLHWFQRLNEIRNRIAHPERGRVSDEELEFIRALVEHFEAKTDPNP
jgi:DGQHR domain-containing protein